jgi:FlaA1/EpsC-like NDP-sugar epimerase
MDVYKIIGRTSSLFDADVSAQEKVLSDALAGARVLVFGGAGSIGKEAVKQIFARRPTALHVIDISENNMAELVRDIRSSLGYIEGETLFLPLDMASPEAAAFLSTQRGYDYVLNLAALKHVRSEKDAYSLMRMVQVNVYNVVGSLGQARAAGARKYFAVSTDKAKNPANLMGATKRIAEDVLFRGHAGIAVSTARFANVAFSDGSLLHGFRQRMTLGQPLSAPHDVRRYFVSGEEAGILCLMASVLGGDREIYFPRLNADANLLTFSEIAIRLLQANGYDPVETASEDEARARAKELIPQGKWPVYFFASDTSGEKPFEEFYSAGDAIDWDRHGGMGVIKAPALTQAEIARLDHFLAQVSALRDGGRWEKGLLEQQIYDACPDLRHINTGRFLDSRM